MAYRRIYEWSTSEGDNDFVGDGGWPEGMARSDVNDMARKDMAALKENYLNPEWIKPHHINSTTFATFARTGNYTFRLALAGNNFTSYFQPGRRVRILDGGLNPTDDHFVESSVYSDPNTDVTLRSLSGDPIISVLAADVRVNILGTGSTAAFELPTLLWEVPTSDDSAGIQGAINRAAAVGGSRVVFLPPATYDIDTTLNLQGSGGCVKLIGCGARSVLEPNASLTGPVIDLGTAVSTDVLLESFSINPGLSLVCNHVEISGSTANVSNMTFRNIDFNQPQIGIDIDNGSIPYDGFVLVDGCQFRQPTEYGVKSNSGPTQDGYISSVKVVNCDFQLNNIQTANGGGVKLIGPAVIANNTFRDVGDDTYSVKAIWLWNSSAANDGGRDSTISGNYIQGTSSNAAVATAIEVGASNVSVTGNSIVMQNIGTTDTDNGIYLRHTTGSFYIENVSVTGNTIEAVNAIRITDYFRNYAISGNALNRGRIWTTAFGSGGTIANNAIYKPISNSILIDDAAANVNVNGNTIDAAVSGIVIDSTGSDISVTNNHIQFAITDGINAENSSGSKVVIANNDVDSSATDEYTYSTTTRHYDNRIDGFTPSEKIRADTQLEVDSTSTEQAFVEGKELPKGGGVGWYRLSYEWKSVSGATTTIRLRVSKNGLLSESGTIVFSQAQTTTGTWNKDSGDITADATTFNITSDDEVKYCWTVQRSSGSVPSQLERWEIERYEDHD